MISIDFKNLWIIYSHKRTTYVMWSSQSTDSVSTMYVYIISLSNNAMDACWKVNSSEEMDTTKEEGKIRKLLFRDVPREFAYWGKSTPLPVTVLKGHFLNQFFSNNNNPCFNSSTAGMTYATYLNKLIRLQS